MKMNIETLARQGYSSDTMAESVSTRIQQLRKRAIREIFQDFRQAAHRMEYVAKVRGVEYIDDAKSYNVNATWFALESMTRPVVWIVGGQTKDVDFSVLRPLVAKKVSRIVCLGADNAPIVAAFGDLVPDIVQTDTMFNAVHAAYLMANEGEVVLLSPSCPSFDLFESYQDKGEQFKQVVYEL